jgi:hypothetical protein
MKTDMETFAIRVPKKVVAGIKKEARERGVSASDVARERLATPGPNAKPDPLADIRDLIGCIDDPSRPTDVSARVDYYLRKTGFGRDRRR